MKVAFTLIPAESRRLIAKAVIQIPEMKKALEVAYVILNGGTTNAMVAQELLGDPNILPEKFCVGTSSHRLLCVNEIPKSPPFPIVLQKGKRVNKTVNEALSDFNINTVVIKGANAVDPEGNVGIVTSGFDSGTVASTFGVVNSQGLKYIVPVGLEKMVPSAQESAGWAGAKTIDYSIGADFGIFFIPKERAHVITEIRALKILFGLEARKVAGGGIGESAGAVVLIAEGETGPMKKAIELIESIKGEPTIKGSKGNCETCKYKCVFKGKKRDDLPAWLK